MTVQLFLRPSRRQISIAFARAVRDARYNHLDCDGYGQWLRIGELYRGWPEWPGRTHHITSVVPWNLRAHCCHRSQSHRYGLDPETAFLQLNGAGETELFIRQIIREVLA